jgi:hypothetical protein
MPVQKPLVMAWDNGSFSGKVKSDITEGSFLSMLAPVTNDTMDSFNPLEFQSREGQNFDLSIYDAISGGWTRWMIGERAEGMDGVQRTTRNMHRATDGIYKVFMCAALRTGFPKIYADKKKLEERQWSPHHSTAQPVALIGSIAPGYFRQWDELAQAALGYYHFVDHSNDQFYSFKIVDVRVVPESFGGYAKRLYTLDKHGHVQLDERGRPVARKGGASLQKITVAAVDIGGRTTDVIIWDGQDIKKFVSLDMGLHQYIEAMIDDLISHHKEKFGTKPTRLEVYRAIAKAPRNGNGIPEKIELIGLYGEHVDVTNVVNRQMNIFTNQFLQEYQDVLSGGQNIEALLWMGGGSTILQPYIRAQVASQSRGQRQQLHEREEWVSKNSQDLWMANAIGGYAWGKMVFDRMHSK